jgi:hypothetical protein
MDRQRPTIHREVESGHREANPGSDRLPHPGVLHRRASTVIGHCARESPTVLPALAAALVEYLVAWRDASPDRALAVVSMESPRLRERGVVLDGLLRQAEQLLGQSPAPVPDGVGPIADEAADILARVRQVVQLLPKDRPEAHRLRLALVEAWGRYDDALAEVRAGGDEVVDADLAVLADLRDALLHHLDVARSLVGGPA